MRLIFTFIFFAQILSAQTWLQIADFPGTERDDGIAVTLNNKSYFGTGLMAVGGAANDFYALDASNTWSPVTSMPAGTQRQYACGFAGPGVFYVFGGDGPNGTLNDLYKYDPASNAWTTALSRPGSGVAGSACLEFGDKIIIVGGKFQSGGNANNEVWEYTISSNSWLQKNNFPFGGRFRASAAVINGTGYLIFGIDDNNHVRKDMYRYNQVADSWTKVLDFPQPAARVYAAMKPVNNRLILFGGYDSLNVYYKDVWYFDPVSETWAQDADFPSFGRKGGMSAVMNNKFYYSCGINLSNTRLKETWTLALPVGIKEYKNTASFSVYPNPAGNIIHIGNSSKTDISAVTITDISGKEVQAIDAAELQNSFLGINLSHLKSGIYFLKITTTGNLSEWKKIIKE